MSGFTFSRLYSFSIKPENAVDEMPCINDAGSKKQGVLTGGYGI